MVYGTVNAMCSNGRRGPSVGDGGSAPGEETGHDGDSTKSKPRVARSVAARRGAPRRDVVLERQRDALQRARVAGAPSLFGCLRRGSCLFPVMGVQRVQPRLERVDTGQDRPGHLDR